MSDAARRLPAGVHASARVHESAYVDDGAVVGEETRIWHFCHVLPGAVIGARCSLGQNVVVMNGTRIGDGVTIQNDVSVYEGVELEDDVFCGPSMVFTNVLNPLGHVSRKHEYRRTLVRGGAGRVSLPPVRVTLVGRRHIGRTGRDAVSHVVGPAVAAAYDLVAERVRGARGRDAVSRSMSHGEGP